MQVWSVMLVFDMQVGADTCHLLGEELKPYNAAVGTENVGKFLGMNLSTKGSTLEDAIDTCIAACRLAFAKLDLPGNSFVIEAHGRRWEDFEKWVDGEGG